MITKQFKRRSSATEVLKQIGVPVRDYNLFIATEGEQVVCQIELAQQHVAKLKEQTGTGGAAPVKEQTHDADLKVSPLPRKYVVNPQKLKYHETAKGVQARCVIDLNGRSFATFDDFPERLVADVQFNSKTDRQLFLQDARKAGQGETSDDHAISEFARKLVHDAEARMLAEGEALRKAKTSTKTEPLQPTFPKVTKIKVPEKGAFTKPTATKSKKAPTPKAKQEARTVTSVARELIVAGKTNDEVWDALVKEFKLSDSKKSYPAWYRRDCKKRGLIA